MISNCVVVHLPDINRRIDEIFARVCDSILVLLYFTRVLKELLMMLVYYNGL